MTWGEVLSTVYRDFRRNRYTQSLCYDLSIEVEQRKLTDIVIANFQKNVDKLVATQAFVYACREAGIPVDEKTWEKYTNV